MNEVTLRSHQLPAVGHPPSQPLARQVQRMEYLATLARVAMDEMSDTYSYNQWKVASTLRTVAQLAQLFDAGHLTPEAEATQRQMSEQYLLAMQQLGEQVALRLLDELRRLSATPANPGLLDGLRALLTDGR